MALQLFEHNTKAYQAVVKMLARYGKAAVVHPTGTGKSYIAFKLIEDHPDAAVFCCLQVSISSRTQFESQQKQAAGFPLANVHFYTMPS